MNRTLVATLLITIFTVMLILGGCATTSKISEPTHENSVLLVGRVRATCEEFEQMWNMNGVHTDKIEIDLRNLSTKDMIAIRSKGADGVFYVPDAEYGVYTIERFSYTSGGSRTTQDVEQ